MAWIELHQSVWTHKKTILMAAILNIDATYAAAHISRLWTWALDNAQNGELTGLPNKVIAFGADWKGDPDEFVDATIEAGWLERDEESLYIHDWFDYAGRLIDKREANKNRMREARAKNKGKRAKNVQRTNKARAGATVPNRTVPNQTEPKDNNPPVSPQGGVSESEPKIQYADYIFMTKDQYQKLTELLGEVERDDYFLSFASWISGQTPRVQESRSAYHTIMEWFRRDQKKPRAPNGSKYQRVVDELTEIEQEAMRSGTG